MEPIISPWLVYLIGITECIRGICVICAIMLFIATIGNTIGFVDSAIKAKFHKWIPITFLMFAFLASIIPDRKTAIAMVVASNVTTDNLKEAGDIALKTKDAIKKDILDLIAEAKKD